jgi:hypothetical protein
MHAAQDEGAQHDQGRPEPAEVHAGQGDTERRQPQEDHTEKHQEAAEVHFEPVPSPGYPQTPPGAVRANGGACRCPSATAGPNLRQLDCTCAWNEVLSAVHLLAYGDLSDDDLIAFAPVVAAMARDAAYRGRDEALVRRLSEWPGTLADFALHHRLDRSRLYQLGIHRKH